MPADRRHVVAGGSGRRFAMFAALISATLIVGPAVAVTGSNGLLQLLMLAGMAAIVGAAAIVYVFEVQPIALLRWAFVASFFFKGDVTFFKIDEVEDPSGFNVSLTVITAVALILYDHLWDSGDKPKAPRSIILLLAALYTAAVASVVLAGMTPLGLASLWSLAGSMLIAYAVVSHFGRRDRIVELVPAVAVGLMVTGAVAVSQYVAEFPMHLPDLGTGTEEEQLGTQTQLFSRVPAFMRTPTEMAWVVSTLIPLMFALLMSRVRELGRVERVLIVAAIAAGALAVLLSLARGSWIGLIIGLILIAMFAWVRLSTEERRSYLVTVAGAFVVVALALAPFGDRIYERLTEDDQGAAAIRIPLVKNAGRTISDNPITGVGLNAYRANITRYDESEDFVSQFFPQPVHNVFAHVTAETGIPGGILFCLVILVALGHGIAATMSRDRLIFAFGLGISVALVAFIISGLKEPGSLGSVRPPMRTLFLMVGIVMAVTSIRTREVYAR